MMTIVPFIKTSIGSMNNCERGFNDVTWINTIIFLDALFTLDIDGRFKAPCSLLVELLETLYDAIPKTRTKDLGELLNKIISESDSVTRNETIQNNLVQDALRVLQVVFSGLCRFSTLQHVTAIAIPFLTRPASAHKSNIDIEIARIICQTLSSTSNTNEYALELFPHLCRLMNSQNVNLRKESAELMSTVDVSGLMMRVDVAESQIMNESDIPHLKANLMRESERASNAEKNVIELKQINSQLMKEVEQLRSENQKLAALSEGSNYL